MATEDVCDHGVSYDHECPTCEHEIAEAKAAGALTPHEIGLYWKGREADAVDLRTAIKALPITCIDGVNYVSRRDLLAALEDGAD